MDEFNIDEFRGNFLSAKQTAKALGVSMNSFYRHVKEFDFPVKRIGKKYLIPKEPLIAYMRNYKNPETEKITTVCFGKTVKWDNRKEAAAYFLDAMQNSEGAEREHYANVLLAINNGFAYCTDSNN